MEERRRAEDKNWEEVKGYIIESREFRAGLKVELEHMRQSIIELNDKVKIQNGRVNRSEEAINKLKGAVTLMALGLPTLLWLINKAYR